MKSEIRNPKAERRPKSEVRVRTSEFGRLSGFGLRSSNLANSQRGSVLIIVLWIAFGLVSITLYFANSMSSELRASDNRVSGLSAEQAIEGAARYVNYILVNQTTNGVMP